LQLSRHPLTLPVSPHYKTTPLSSILALGAVMAFACVLAKDNVEFPEIARLLANLSMKLP